MADAIEVDREAMARDWIGFALRWADDRRRSDRRRGLGDAIDWDSVALDGLHSAVRGFRPRWDGGTMTSRYLLRCLSGASAGPVRRRRRWRANLVGRPIPESPDRDLPPASIRSRECDPAALAAIREECPHELPISTRRRPASGGGPRHLRGGGP